MSTVPERNVEARHLVWSLYRDSADEDYLIARRSAQSKLSRPFYWNALQALEKYLKCILLLNDRSIDSYSHDLVKPWLVVKEVCGRLLPDLICPPHYVNTRRTGISIPFELTEQFLKRYEYLGHPNNRYRYYSTSHGDYDLHKFDEVCFRLRRVCFPLDMIPGSETRSFREILSIDDSIQIHHQFSFLPTTLKGAERRRRIQALSWMNFSYCEDLALKRGKVLAGGRAENSSLWLLANTI